MFFILFWMGPHLRHFHTISFWVGSRDPKDVWSFFDRSVIREPRSHSNSPELPSGSIQEMNMEDLVTYNSSISACATASEWSQALALLSELPQRRLEESFFFLYHGLVVLDVEKIPLIPGINLLVYIGMVWNSWPQENGRFTALLRIYNDQFISPFHEAYPDVR